LLHGLQGNAQAVYTIPEMTQVACALASIDSVMILPQELPLLAAEGFACVVKVKGK
jgi:hypothetical protein